MRRIRQWRRAARAPMTTCASVLALLLAGCATGGTSTARATVTAIPSATATATATETEAPTATASTSTRACDPAKMSHPVMAGDLAISVPEILWGFNADYLLPDGLPNAPLEVDLHDGSFSIGGRLLTSQPVAGSVAFVSSVCNTSQTKAHALTTFGATLISSAPYAGPLNTLNGCAFLYAQPYGTGGECASGYEPDVEETLRFATSDGQGATAMAPPPFAVTLSPGTGLDVGFFITPPAAKALLRYRLGVGVDGGAVMYPALDTAVAVNGTIGQHWDGHGCSAPAMQAQLPKSYPANVFYACPPAS